MRNLSLEFLELRWILYFSSLGISLLSGSIRGGGGTVHVLESREISFHSCILSSNSMIFM